MCFSFDHSFVTDGNDFLEYDMVFLLCHQFRVESGISSEKKYNVWTPQNREGERGWVDERKAWENIGYVRTEYCRSLLSCSCRSQIWATLHRAEIKIMFNWVMTDHGTSKRVMLSVIKLSYIWQRFLTAGIWINAISDHILKIQTGSCFFFVNEFAQLWIDSYFYLVNGLIRLHCLSKGSNSTIH